MSNIKCPEGFEVEQLITEIIGKNFCIQIESKNNQPIEVKITPLRGFELQRFIDVLAKALNNIE
jgi:dihydroorotate dehydrogenase